MNSPVIAYVLQLSFSTLVACFVAATVSAIVIFFNTRKINQALKHPYLEHRTFEQYPMAIRLGILLDYFLRVTFPTSKIWLAGHANRMLKHVDPKKISLGLKWPLVGLWGGCFLGMIAMITMWTTLLVSR
ncbi:hypothetical protein RBI13_05965 [Alcaligenaceae bacterium A4P071]|nr:hypothetical protein [Alcaligenaceae bacterium B3P038]MDQ2147404.1 hypothetical protein [Alcaligenaceae bacterium C4P045]MDQ2184734.1 hypothetical protein [Alcaligenaceae bacterium A4P071]